MKICLLSYTFRPNVGGTEAVASFLEHGLGSRGHELLVVTRTPSAQGERAVLRDPSVRDLIGALNWSEVVLQCNVSLSLGWPLAVRCVRRPWVVVNHTPIRPPTGAPRIRDIVKMRTLPEHTYWVSKGLQEDAGVGGGVLFNAYDTTLFHEEVEVKRNLDLLFVGRVTRAKGLGVLLQALSILQQERNIRPTLDVLGDGDELRAMREMSEELGVGSQVTFRGAVAPSRVAESMRAARILVVPSTPYPIEAFGLVAIEGIACGCAVVASDCGGLREAVGQCGKLVPPQQPRALADALRSVLADVSLRNRLLANRAEHIRLFSPEVVLNAYEQALERAVVNP